MLCGRTLYIVSWCGFFIEYVQYICATAALYIIKCNYFRMTTVRFFSKLLASLMRNYFQKRTSGAPLHTVSKLYDVPVCSVPPPPLLRQCIAIFAVAEGWLLLDIGWFVLFVLVWNNLKSDQYSLFCPYCWVDKGEGGDRLTPKFCFALTAKCNVYIHEIIK